MKEANIRPHPIRSPLRGLLKGELGRWVSDNMKLIRVYINAVNQLGVRGRSWRRYVANLTIAGVPISVAILICSMFAVFGLVHPTINGEPIVGWKALCEGLFCAFIVMPIISIIVASMDFLVTEIWKKDKNNTAL